MRKRTSVELCDVEAPAEDADWERVPPAAPARDDAELRRRRVERFG